jgi:DNA-binding MarR family transcriptional regulator
VLHYVDTDNDAVYNEVVTLPALLPTDALEGGPQPRYAEDADGYLYDAGFREVLTRFAKLDPEKLHQAEAMRAMVMAGKRLYALLEEQMVELGVTHGQYRALKCIKEYGLTGTQMHSIAGYLGVTPRNVTGLVDGLEAARLVERVADPGDRRATIVRVTEKGHSVAQKGKRIHELVVGKVMGILTEDEKLQLRHLSTKLLRAIEEVTATERRKSVG